MWAATKGFFNGMYWINYHTIKFDLTNKSNRSIYKGWENFFRTITGLTVPIIGGAMLTFLPSNYNSKALFISAIIFITLSIFIGNFHSTKNSNLTKINFINTGKILLKDNKILKSLFSASLGGFVKKGAFFTMLIPLYILMTVNNEFELGNILAGISIIAAITSVIIGKRIKFKFFKKSIVIGILLQIASIIPIIISPNLVTFLIYSIFQTLSLPFSDIPSKVISTNIIHKIHNYKDHRIEYFAINEFFNIILGWIPSYLLLLFFSDIQSQTTIIYLLIFMIVFTFVEMILLISIPEKDYSN